ncbi:MAG: hypothetical protein RKO66_14570 [Candidatus Contendobacter sp.]|nr:hypothetical protein [Candidatus Contendobacter sp.]MDS4057629.1 hypothetical protein [Candidatus Contendobacter sp.]
MIPQPIYELLPYLYMLAGLITLFALDNIPGKLCGVILIIAGVIIQQIRARARGKKLIHSANVGRDPRSGRPAANAGREPASRRSLPDRSSKRP